MRLNYFSVTALAYLLKSAIFRSIHDKVCGRNLANKISRLKVPKLGNAKVTNAKATKKLDYCLGTMIIRVIVESGQLRLD